MIHVGVAQHLGENVRGLKYSETGQANVFVDLLPSSPDRVVCVYSTPGGEADSKLPYDPFTLQILFRSEADGEWALEKWAAAYSELHALRYLNLPDGTKLVYLLVTTASPMRLGPDQSGRAQYTMNLRGEVHNPTEERKD